MISMVDEDAQARSGADTPGVADAGRGGRMPTGASDGAESITATRGRTKAEVAMQLMEQVVERGNMWKARVRRGLFVAHSECCATRERPAPMACRCKT